MAKYSNFHNPIIQPDEPQGWEAANQSVGAGIQGLGAMLYQKEQAKQEMANQIEMYKQKAMIEGQVSNQSEMERLKQRNQMMLDYTNSNPELFTSNQGQSGSMSPFMLMPNSKGELMPVSRAKIQAKALSPILENYKNKRTESVIGIVNDANNSRITNQNALKSVQNLKSGLGGKVTYGVIKNLDANNPLLGDWQNLKMALTNAQLLTSGPLKGSISDAEQKWLAAASANDDLISIPRAEAVLNKINREINAREKTAVSSYSKIYGENPYDWNEAKSNMNDIEKSSGEINDNDPLRLR